MFAILLVSCLLTCAIAVAILCHEKCQDQLPGALLLTAGASFPSCVQCSSPLPCTHCLVAILLLLLLRCLVRARPSSE